MDDGGVTLDPHPAAVLGQEAIILGGDLSFHEHCRRQALFVIRLSDKDKLAERGCERIARGGQVYDSRRWCAQRR